MTTPGPTPSRRAERILAYMFIGLVALAVLGILLLLLSSFLGNSGRFDQGLWPVIAITPLIALPLAFILGIALFFVVNRRRIREAAASPAPVAKGAPKARTKNSGARSPKSK